jgi:Cof subfamily protein (haloacid dehalogenase superfamily)
MIRLILTDVDGTLIGSGSRIHPRVLEALDRARAAGLHLGICTGRPLYSLARDYAKLISANEPHIFQNGAQVCKPDGETVFQSTLAPAAYVALVEAARRERFALEVYTPSTCFVEIQSKESLEHQALIQLQVTQQDLLSIGEPIIRVQWVLTPQQAPKAMEIIRGVPEVQFSSAGTPDLPTHVYTSVTRLGTSKLEGAQALAAYYGLELSQVMMVGDGENDLEVLRGVGYGVAMGNAPQIVKDAAQMVVGDVDDGGLAQAIEFALERV